MGREVGVFDNWAGLSSITIASIITNSLRRGGNTAAAAGGVPGFLRRGHGRWRLAAQQRHARLEMVDLYDEVDIERKLSVSYLTADSVIVSDKFGSPVAIAKHLDFSRR